MSAYENGSPVLFAATLASVDTICGLARVMPPTLGLMILRALEKAIEVPPTQPNLDELTVHRGSEATLGAMRAGVSEPKL